jgi:menaquinone-9 beta-reductase
MSRIVKSEIAIIGAGPSGTTLSIALAQKGIPHLILDAATFPRDKVCGDGLDLKVFRILRHLFPEITTSEVFNKEEFMECWGCRVINPNRSVTDFDHSKQNEKEGRPIFRTSKRYNFDQFLVNRLNANYADFRQNTKVTGIEKEGDNWKLQATDATGDLEIQCKLLIGADGDHSVVLRNLGDRKIDRKNYAGSVRQYWAGIEGFHPKNLIEVFFVPEYPMSYFYIFPLPNGEANVGYGMVSEVIAQKKLNLREIFAKVIETDPYMSPRFKNAKPLEEPIGWGLPLASRRRKTFGDGYLLLGDAASLICPMNGEGIGTGMLSGYIASFFIENALKTKDFSENSFQNFDREIYRRLDGDISTFKIMQKIPLALHAPLINIGINAPAKWLFGSIAQSWLKTAYEKQIEVNIK